MTVRVWELDALAREGLEECRVAGEDRGEGIGNEDEVSVRLGRTDDLRGESVLKGSARSFPLPFFPLLFAMVLP